MAFSNVKTCGPSSFFTSYLRKGRNRGLEKGGGGGGEREREREKKETGIKERRE
jgi:hypothetical protein